MDRESFLRNFFYEQIFPRCNALKSGNCCCNYIVCLSFIYQYKNFYKAVIGGFRNEKYLLTIL